MEGQSRCHNVVVDGIKESEIEKLYKSEKKEENYSVKNYNWIN